MADRPLNARQIRFAAEYLVDLNASAAYVRAGYAPEDARVGASKLLAHPNIAAIVAAGKARHIKSAELSASRVLEEMRRLAFVDARGFWNEDGSLKAMHQLTEEQGAALASFEAIIKNAAAGDGVTDTVHKIKLWDKVRALEMLAKHFALLTEVVRVEEAEAMEAKLDRGRERVAAMKAARDAQAEAHGAGGQ